MIRNQGHIDRAIRVVLGIALLTMVFAGPKSWLGLIGVIPLATGLAGFCPLYRLFGMSTCGTVHRIHGHEA